jgi:hypothetical protein
MATQIIPLPVEKGYSLTCRNISLSVEIHCLAQAGVPKGCFILIPMRNGRHLGHWGSLARIGVTTPNVQNRTLRVRG